MSDGRFVDDDLTWLREIPPPKKFNPSHEPAGSPTGGQFASGGGEVGTSTTPAEFIAARDRSSRIEMLSPLKPDDLSDHTLLTNKDKTVGVAIDKNGDLQNLFNNGGPKGAAGRLVAQAIGKGARTLDAYDGYLPNYYRQFGFIETGRIKFNPDFASSNWDSSRLGQPDVVFMAWNGYPSGGVAGAIARASSTRESWIANEPTSKYYQDYDTAKSDSRRSASNRSAGKESSPADDRSGNYIGPGASQGYRPTLVKPKFNPNHAPAGSPEGGQFTSGDGEGGGGGGGKLDHPGFGYSDSATEDANGVIHTDNVYDAALALSQDRKVDLNQPKTVSTLIQHLGQVAKSMEVMGEHAPNFNLCNVTVQGTDLFCVNSKGIPRIQMPQLDAKQTKEFVGYLKDQGYDVTKSREFSSYLRATQNELNGVKVAGLMAKYDAGDFNPDDARLIVSKDNYILDGHHRWAADVGIDAKNGVLNDEKKIKITRVDISITKLLEEAETFTGGAGKKPASERSIIVNTVKRMWARGVRLKQMRIT